MKYLTTIYSPNGKQSIECHPSSLDQMLGDGWTTEKKTNKVTPIADNSESEETQIDQES